MEQIKCPHCNSSDVVVSTTRPAASLGGTTNNSMSESGGHLVPQVGNRAAAPVSVEYACRTCDCLFKTLTTAEGSLKEISIKKEPMPDRIINNVRVSYISTLRDDRPFISMGFFLLITLYCLVYFLIGVAEKNGHQIFFSYICSIPFESCAIIKLKKIDRINKEIEECKRQPLPEFKHTHRYLFNQYSQYN